DRHSGALRKRYRAIYNQSRWGEAVIQRRQIDKGFDRRSGLSLRLGCPVELADLETEATADSEHTAGMRVHGDEGAGNLGHLTESEGGLLFGARRIGLCSGQSDRLDHHDVAWFADIGSTTRVRPELGDTAPWPRPAHFRKRDIAGSAVTKANRRTVGIGAHHHRQAPTDVLCYPGHRHPCEVSRPIALRVDPDDRSTPPAVAVIIGN